MTNSRIAGIRWGGIAPAALNLRRAAMPWFALALVPIAWIIVLTVVALVRWIRRGFQPPGLTG